MMLGIASTLSFRCKSCSDTNFEGQQCRHCVMPLMEEAGRETVPDKVEDLDNVSVIRPALSSDMLCR